MSTKVGDCSAAERNKQPIFEALTPWLSGMADVLEVGAGDATHARDALCRLPDIRWQTSEAPGHHRRLVAAIADRQDIGLPPPLALDVCGPWPDRVFDAIYGANVAHIMAWRAVEALFAGAGSHLRTQGLLCLYGPFIAEGELVAAGNIEFDAALRTRDPDMGLRKISALDTLALAHDMTRVADMPMPSNNRLLLWRRQ